MSFLDYNTTIPAANIAPAADQPKMLTNNVSTSAIIAIDHYGFKNASGGWHKQVTLPIESRPASLAGQAVLYANTDGQSQLFATADAGGKAYQLTNFDDSLFSTFAKNSNGWIFLPGGLIMNYGSSNSTSSGSITYSRAFTTLVSIWANPTFGGSSPNGEATVALKAGNSNFTFSFVTSSGAYNGFYWAAIGV